jgi:hypothetical protein
LRYKITNPQLSKENLKEEENFVAGQNGRLTPRWTGRLTVGRNLTLTFCATKLQTRNCQKKI